MNGHDHCWKSLFVVLCLALSACGGSDKSAGGNDPGGNDPGGVTPPAADFVPDGFVLEDVANADPGVYYMANMTVRGVDTAVKARVTGATAQFSMDGGNTWQTEAADVEIGDNVVIRLRASEEADGIVDGSLHVGSTQDHPSSEGTVSDSFRVVTKSDIEKPQLVVLFPPAYSLTDVPLPGGIMRIRGRVSDNEKLDSFEINGTPVTISTDGSWISDYEVQPGENLIVVTAVDASENRSETRLTLVHVQNQEGNTFGTGYGFSNPKAAMWDDVRNRLLGLGVEVLAIDIATGERSPVTANFGGAGAIVPDSAGDRYLVAKRDISTTYGQRLFLYQVDPVTGARELVTRRGDGQGPDTDFRYPVDIAVDQSGKRILLLSWSDASTNTSHVWEVDGDAGSSSFGERTKFSDEAFSTTAGLALDAVRDRWLIADGAVREIALSSDPDTMSKEVIPETADFCPNQIRIAGDLAWGRSRCGQDVLMEINLVTGDYVAVSNLDDPSFGPVPYDSLYPQPPGLDAEQGVFFLVSHSATVADPSALMAIDLETGYRVLVTLEP